MGCGPSVSAQAKVSDKNQIASSRGGKDDAVSDDAMYFLCTQKGFILDINALVETELLYTKQDLKSKFIGIIMSPFISFLHKKVFLKRLQSLSGLEHSRLLFKLKDLSIKRPFIVYDLHGLPVYVSVHIVLHTADEIAILYKELEMKSDFDFSTLKKNEKYVMLQINRIMSKNSVAKMDTVVNMNSAVTTGGSFPGLQVGSQKSHKTDMAFMMSKAIDEEMSYTFKVTTNNVVVICIDIMDSTQMLMEKGPHHMATISAQFYKDVVDTIKTHFYPFIYIYEIVGDCFMFIVNADWTYNISPFCAIISIYFIKHLIKRVKEYISIRAGFSFGKISYGVIGDNIRFFGETINLSARLEHECGRNELLISGPLYQKFKAELISTQIMNKQSSETFIMPDKQELETASTWKSTSSELNATGRSSGRSSEDGEDATFHIFDVNKDVEQQFKSLKGFPKEVECYRILPQNVSNILSFLDSVGEEN